jgi:hypothetical protein
MDDPRYDILFGGELLPGFAPGTVAENLGKLFKATPETVARLMGGGTHALKRGADRETALRYEAAMQKAGARAVLREVAATAELPHEAPPVAAASPAPASAVPPAPTSVAPITLAAAGAELLAGHERRVVEPVVVDTRHIKLVSSFMAPPEPERAPPPPAPDTRHLSIAAPGADLLPERATAQPPPPPDTSAISLAEPGARLGEESAPPAIDLPDTSAISLAPPGTPLEELRPERKPLNPDTSALRLEPLSP